MSLNNEIDEARVTILLPFNKYDEEGNYIYYFKPFTQYCYSIEDDKIIVDINGHKYNLTGETISLDVRTLSSDEQLSPNDAEKKRLEDNQVHDHKKETLEVLGIDIKADERADYNGRWLEKFLRKEDKNINE